MKLKHDYVKSYRLGRKTKVNWKEKLFVLFVGLLTLFALLVFLSQNEYLLIDDIKVIGTKVLEEDELSADVQEEISGYYLSLFPKNNIFLYPQRKIKSRLLDTHKRIGEIKVRLRSANELLVKVTEREGEYLWCGEKRRTDAELERKTDAKLGAEEKCYFVDKESFIFATSPYFSSNVFFTFYGSPTEEGGKPQGSGIGSYLFTESEFKRIILFKEFLSDIGVTTYALLKKDDGDYELFLVDSFSREESLPRIVFNQSNDFEKILNNLNSALKTEPLSNLDERLAELEYIDLRFDNKVVYKFTNQ